jgi:hypothetical protein
MEESASALKVRKDGIEKSEPRPEKHSVQGFFCKNRILPLSLRVSKLCRYYDDKLTLPRISRKIGRKFLV